MRKPGNVKMKHLPNNFRWSFSKLAAFKQCPMSFYLSYIENPGSDEELPGYFSEYGSLMHSILEGYYKGELPEFCLADEWRSRYDKEVLVPPPPFRKDSVKRIMTPPSGISKTLMVCLQVMK